MTMVDLGPERPSEASETRQMSEADRVSPTARFGDRTFWIAAAAIVVVLVLLVLLLR